MNNSDERFVIGPVTRGLSIDCKVGIVFEANVVPLMLIHGVEKALLGHCGIKFDGGVAL